MRRAIENFIEDPLSEELLKGEFEGKDRITVEAIKNDEDKLVRLKFAGHAGPAAVPKQEPAAAVAGADGEDGDAASGD